MDNQPTLALDRVLQVLRPLVRLLVNNGVTYPVFTAALKRVFLDAAQHELARRGMATTDSAVSLLSGVHRRDVRTFTRGAEAAARGSEPPVLGLAAQVVAHWMNDPAYSAYSAYGPGRGTPRVLPRSGPAPSFDALVTGISSDVRGKAVLDELLRLGVVTETDSGVVLDRSGFAPRGNFAEASWLAAQNLHDHAAAMVANLQGEGRFLEQAVFVDEIGAESAEQLRQVSLAAWKAAFKTVMPVAQQRFDADAAQLPPEERRHRARFGVYFFSNPAAPHDKEAPE
jgi:hypothetical protein